jgi:heme/copper-type cytochrome/quinol oxidase subunit 4
MSYINDGILDLFVGFIALLAGFMFFSDMFWMAGVYVAIFLPIVWSVKEKVTMPRLRREELDPAAAQRSSKILAVFLVGLLLFAVLGLLYFLLFQNPDLASETKRLLLFGAASLIAAAVLGGFLFVGTVYHAPRWYAYAAVAALFSALAWWQQIGLPWVIATIGTMMVLTGAVYLARFIRQHPILPEGERPAW